MKKFIDRENLSQKAIEVCDRFRYSAKEKILYDDIDFEPEGLVLITGKSGCGKSTVLKELAEKYEYESVLDIENVEARVIDLISLNLSDTISVLSKAGLSEVPLFLTKYKDLSTGQKYRFDIIYSIVNGRRRLMLDEFCAYLDTTTAQTCAYNFQKLFRERKVSVIAATCRTDLNKFFKADYNLQINDDEKINITNEKSDINPFAKDIYIKTGEFTDYIRFEKYHYAFDIDRDFYDEHNGIIHTIYYKNKKIGIIMYISPYDIYEAESIQEFSEINDKLVCIYRIVLAPNFRGLGLTKLIIENSSNLISQEYVYIFSAMAIYNKFLSRAGFTRIAPIDYRREKEYTIVSDYAAYKNKINREEVLEREIKLLAVIEYKWYSQYCNILNRNKAFNIRSFFEYYKDAFDVSQIDDLMLEMKYMDMEHYYIHK